MSPVIDQIAEEHPDIKVDKINVDDEPDLAEKYSVMSIPTFAFIKDGELQNKQTGARAKADILQMIGK